MTDGNRAEGSRERTVRAFHRSSIHYYYILILIILPVGAALGFIIGNESIFARTLCVVVLLVFYPFLYILYTRVLRWIREVHTASVGLRPSHLMPILEQELAGPRICIRKRRIGFISHLMRFQYAASYDLGDREAILEVVQDVDYSQRRTTTWLAIGRRWNSPKEFSEQVMNALGALQLPEDQGFEPDVEREISKLFDLHRKAAFGISLGIGIASLLILSYIILALFGYQDNPYVLILFLIAVLVCMAPVTILEAMIARLAWRN